MSYRRSVRSARKYARCTSTETRACTSDWSNLAARSRQRRHVSRRRPRPALEKRLREVRVRVVCKRLPEHRADDVRPGVLDDLRIRSVQAELREPGRPGRRDLGFGQLELRAGEPALVALTNGARQRPPRSPGAACRTGGRLRISLAWALAWSAIVASATRMRKERRWDMFVNTAKRRKAMGIRHIGDGPSVHPMSQASSMKTRARPRRTTLARTSNTAGSTRAPECAARTSMVASGVSAPRYDRADVQRVEGVRGAQDARRRARCSLRRGHAGTPDRPSARGGRARRARPGPGGAAG